VSRGAASRSGEGSADEEIRRRPRRSRGFCLNWVTGFIGGSPASVLLRLLVVSFVVGLILAMFGFDPETVYESFERGVRHLIEFGLTDFRQFGRILLTGAMVVLPIWFVLRLLGARRTR
jgi:hypothetical protein